MPSSRAKAAEVMRTVLFEDDVHPSTQPANGLATQLATFDVANNYSDPVIRDLVGRPGLDPGTLRAVQSNPLTSLNIHFVWSNDVASVPTFAEVFGGLKDWLGDWLGDDSSAPGLANMELVTDRGSLVEYRQLNYWVRILPSSDEVLKTNQDQ